MIANSQFQFLWKINVKETEAKGTIFLYPSQVLMKKVTNLKLVLFSADGRSKGGQGAMPPQKKVILIFKKGEFLGGNLVWARLEGNF